MNANSFGAISSSLARAFITVFVASANLVAADCFSSSNSCLALCVRAFALPAVSASPGSTSSTLSGSGSPAAYTSGSSTRKSLGSGSGYSKSLPSSIH